MSTIRRVISSLRVVYEMALHPIRLVECHFSLMNLIYHLIIVCLGISIGRPLSPQLLVDVLLFES
jgi:hypothetical protein